MGVRVKLVGLVGVSGWGKLVDSVWCAGCRSGHTAGQELDQCDSKCPFVDY